jgi:luxR family response regulator
VNEAEPTRVLLVEDQQLIRRGLAMLLSTVDGIDVTAQAEDGRAALDILATTEVDVVLVDARMPGMDGIEFTAHCTRDHPRLPVLVLTTFDDDALVQAVFSVGASGFLLKDTSIEHLVSALYSVIEGGMVIDPRVARAAVQTKSGREGPLAILTHGERVVAELVAQGLTNSEIAASLSLAEGTVKNYVSALLRKIDGRDRTALALKLRKALGF